MQPSAEDVRVTKRIAAGARMLKINFLDHVIVGQPIAGFLGYFSFHEAGLLRRQNKKTKTYDRTDVLQLCSRAEAPSG